MKKPRVAFIVQRCGVEVNGGAEAHCLQIAQRMARHWDTEVLTTCALDYMTWENSYPAGLEEIGGTIVRRFPVDQPRDVTHFDELSARLRGRGVAATQSEQEEWMQAQGPISSGLLDYLGAHRGEYDAFIFFGYLYATTYFGLPLVQEKAFLAPLAHDEWTIYLSMWDSFFARPRALIFNTSFEKEFLRRRLPSLSLEGPVVAVGIEPPADFAPELFRARYGLDDPFLLYVGRIDESKGCRWLIENFVRARNAGRIQHKLVLAGTEVMPIPFHDDVIHLGFIDEAQKWSAMAACDWLVMPSPHESLSMVLLEAWGAGRPALVTGDAEVLVGQCRRANAGLWYRNSEEFEAILRTIDGSTKQRLGARGRQFVATHYSWERVVNNYADLFEEQEAIPVYNRRG
ncbi:MAG: glycosyltransferase family 4 protein [Chthoniobacterales bacterium]